ncbi:MAG: hypothetical protein HW390_2535 [Candidatus Brocadiaceae bacterium]|nr:hypothetical protein [Candidatus Brocadiaceae bacterium]
MEIFYVRRIFEARKFIELDLRRLLFDARVESLQIKQGVRKCHARWQYPGQSAFRPFG